MKCPNCQHDNTATAKFCEGCAAPLRERPDAPPRRKVIALDRSRVRKRR